MAASVVVAEGESERRSMDAILDFPREGNGLCGGEGHVYEDLPRIDGCWTRAR